MCPAVFIWSLFGYTDYGISWFSSVVRLLPWYNAKKGRGPHSVRHGGHNRVSSSLQAFSPSDRTTLGSVLRKPSYQSIIQENNKVKLKISKNKKIRAP